MDTWFNIASIFKRRKHAWHRLFKNCFFPFYATDLIPSFFLLHEWCNQNIEALLELYLMKELQTGQKVYGLLGGSSVEKNTRINKICAFKIFFLPPYALDLNPMKFGSLWNNGLSNLSSILNADLTPSFFYTLCQLHWL